MSKDWRDGIPDAKAWLNARGSPSFTQARDNDPPEIAALREEGRAIEDAKRPSNAFPEPAPQGDIRREAQQEAQAQRDARYAEIKEKLAEFDRGQRQKNNENER